MKAVRIKTTTIREDTFPNLFFSDPSGPAVHWLQNDRLNEDISIQSNVDVLLQVPSKAVGPFYRHIVQASIAGGHVA